MGSAVGDAFLAVESAAAASASAAAILAGAAVGGEALCRACQLLLVAAPALLAYRRRPPRAAGGVGATRAAVAAAPSATPAPGAAGKPRREVAGETEAREASVTGKVGPRGGGRDTEERHGCEDQDGCSLHPSFALFLLLSVRRRFLSLYVVSTA